jgi:RNA-directed DNA polymerase
VFIPKPNGDLRPLGIPTVVDRVIQQAIAQLLTPIFDPHFSTHSYGFRYGNRAHKAVRSVQAAARAGYGYAVDCDLKSFFDTVKSGRLIKLLARRISDQRVLRLIGAYLRAGVKLPEGSVEATTQRVPQGGALSPLLANIKLDPLDKELARRGLRFARYADDFLVLVKSLRAAQRVMESVSKSGLLTQPREDVPAAHPDHPAIKQDQMRKREPLAVSVISFAFEVPELLQ